MSKILKTLLLFTLVTFVVWVAVLWHWEVTHREMTVSDIVIYLGVLPLAIVGLILAFGWAWKGAKERAAAPPAPAAGSGPAAPPAQEDAQRHATVKVLAAHVCSPTGEAADDMLAAAEAGKPKPELFDALRDDDGRPVVCARIASMDTEAFKQQLEPVLAAVRGHKPEWEHAAWPEHVVRALTALQEPMGKALQSLQPWAQQLGAAPPDDAPPASAAPTGKPNAMVRTLVAWPLEWSEFDIALANGWLRSCIGDVSATPIPASRFAVDAKPLTGEELLLKADQLLQLLAREGRNDVVLVAACHSGISEAAVGQLSRERRLFSPEHHPKGVMPGEGAAALVLALPQWPAAPDEEDPPVHLHRPCVAKRDKSIEAAGKVSSDCLRQAVGHALTAGRIEPDKVGALVCDADQHSQRSTELFGTTLELLPHLDPTEDMRLIGVGTGHTGVANALLVVAAAAARARSADKPTVALTLGDAFWRLALLVRPAAPQPDTGGTPA